MDFRGLNLTGANLKGANIYRANLCGANLDDADLKHARMSRADLSFARLDHANFTMADLSGAEAFVYGLRQTGTTLGGIRIPNQSLIPVYEPTERIGHYDDTKMG